ncbi:DUF4126 domain-containing protein [Noviherbaspirillum soli]|uniref:DUF4126 domain-containing protein n=1 Tax=Noviherbaspirillum soli TaxID=1064518 RepID=UPI00188AF646|nr:DUF4126 domain-containing protein [Noviherbaspirillum soli]
MVETLSATALAGGLSWASGLRLYMTLFMAGAMARAGWLELPSALQVLESPWVLGVTGLLLVVEFLADKIPGVDSAWDAVQTFIRIPAGAILSVAALGQMDPAWTTIAALLGGTLAASAHFTKAGSRALINTSPEPFSNWAASFSEEAVVATGLWAAFFHPWLWFVLLALFLVLTIWLLPKLWRGMRWLFRKFST